jgi:hypothetical protein
MARYGPLFAPTLAIYSDLTELFFESSDVRKEAWKGNGVVPKKRFNAEQIATLLRHFELQMTQGKYAPETCRDAETSHQNSAMSR